MIKNTATAILGSLLMIGCTQQSGDSMGTASQSETGAAAEQQKNQIEEAAQTAESQVTETAEAQKNRIEAEAQAAKANIEAEQARAEAAQEAGQKNIEQQSQQIQEAAGSAQQSVQGQQQDDQQLLSSVKQQTQQQPGVQASVQSGVVTLNGTVSSEQEKTQIETQVKSIQGVQEVKNELTVGQQPQSLSGLLSNPCARNVPSPGFS